MSLIPPRHSSSAAVSGSSASSGQITGIPVCSRHTGTSGTGAMNSALASDPHFQLADRFGLRAWVYARLRQLRCVELQVKDKVILRQQRVPLAEGFGLEVILVGASWGDKARPIEDPADAA